MISAYQSIKPSLLLAGLISAATLLSACQTSPFTKDPVPEPRYIPSIVLGEAQTLTVMPNRVACASELPAHLASFDRTYHSPHPHRATSPSNVQATCSMALTSWHQTLELREGSSGFIDHVLLNSKAGRVQITVARPGSTRETSNVSHFTAGRAVCTSSTRETLSGGDWIRFTAGRSS